MDPRTRRESLLLDSWRKKSSGLHVALHAAPSSSEPRPGRRGRKGLAEWPPECRGWSLLRIDSDAEPYFASNFMQLNRGR